MQLQSAIMGSAVAKNHYKPIIVRNASRDDMDDVLDLMKELEQELLGDEHDAPKYTVEDLILDCGYNSDTAQPLFVCFVAEEVCGADGSSQTNAIIGYALCYCQYPGNLGDRVLHLEDLYVRPSHRAHGLGPMLLEHVQKSAGCALMTWNMNTEFYKRSGAKDFTETSMSTLLQGG